MDNKEEKFQVPAKPWGDKEIKFLNANQEHLDKKTLAELGIGGAQDSEVKVLGIKDHKPEKPEVKAPDAKEEGEKRDAEAKKEKEEKKGK